MVEIVTTGREGSQGLMGSGAEMEGGRVWTRYRTVESGSEGEVEVVEEVGSGVLTDQAGALDVEIAAPGILVDDGYANATPVPVDEEVSVDGVDVKTTKSATLMMPAVFEVVGDDVVGTMRM